MYAFFVVISLYVIVVRFCTCVAFPAPPHPTQPTSTIPQPYRPEGLISKKTICTVWFQRPPDNLDNPPNPIAEKCYL